MTEELLAILDIPLAWKRVKEDLADERGFYTPPFELALVEIDFDPWLERLADDLRHGTYSPSPIAICDVPKGRGAVRPGAHLWLLDQVVYAAAVGACLPAIYSAVNWSKRQIDYSYSITSLTGAKWLRSRFQGWMAYKAANLSRLDGGAAYVVKTDVSSCYEHIALRTLQSDLRAINAPSAAVHLLVKCLNRWAQVGGRSLPQGLSASHILAKLYLTRIDQALCEAGYEHHRYVDDFVVFARTRSEAKRALVELTRIARARGLSLASAKTSILNGRDARPDIDSVGPVLKPLVAAFVGDFAAALSVPVQYFSVAEAEELMAQNGDFAPLELIRSAYQTYFIDTTSHFQSTLFHFLLNRLRKAKSDFAVSHAMSLLESHPEETAQILSYVGAVVPPEAVDAILVEFIRSDDAVYSYQLYQLFSWRARFSSQPSDAFVDVARSLSSAGDSPAFLRSACRQFLGKFGTLTDLERLEQQYAHAQSDVERSELICCLARLEETRRNGFFGVAKHDGEYARRAVAFVLGGNNPR